MLMLNFKRFIVAFILSFSLSLSAHATEFIENFNSDITVNQDGSLTITETIRIHHEGNKIRRGIYRDLATTKGEYYKVIEVERNNFPEPWFTEKTDTAFRINTGDDELLPAPATSTYKLTYTMYDALRTIRNENLNELYLNVTGKWDFPIDRVEISVHYPENTQVVRQYLYKTNHNAQKLPVGSTFIAENLPAGFEVTIAQAFTQGTVRIPFPKIYKTLIYALLATLIYYLIAWFLCGKDPQSLPIVPDWEAPADLSPLECAILEKKGSIPSNSFFIHIVWLIYQKVITMNTQKYKGLANNNEVYELTTNQTTTPPAKNSEAEFYTRKFPNFLRLSKQPSATITDYELKLVALLIRKLNKKYYNCHKGIIFLGALVFPCVWGYLFPESIGLMFWCLVWCSGIPILIVQRHLFLAVLYTCIFIPILFILCMNTILYAVMFAIYGTLVYIFNYLMFQPTFIGQRQIEKIAGLKMFLETINNNKTAQADKRITPQDMEHLFPYAVALGLEKAWSKKYEAIFGTQKLSEELSNHTYYNSSLRSNLSNYCSKAASYSISGGPSGTGSSGGGHAGGGCGGGGGGGR